MAIMKAMKAAKSNFQQYLAGYEGTEGQQEVAPVGEKVCFSDGDYAFRVAEPGAEVDISSLVDGGGDTGGMNGSDGTLEAAVVVTKTGSVYYLDRHGNMVNLKKGTVSDQRKAYEERETPKGLGRVTIGERLELADRSTSPVVGVYVDYMKKNLAPEAKPDPNAPVNPFAYGRELVEERKRLKGQRDRQVGRQALRRSK